MESYYLIPEENNLELPNENYIQSVGDDGVQEFIDTKFYLALIDRIKFEVKTELKNVLNLNELNVSIPKVIENVTNDILITTLKSEV